MATDRNKQARDEFAAARERKQFQDALTSGQAGVRDRFGALLAEGDQVLFHPAFDVVAVVAKIVPVFDPRVPVGTMQIVLQTTIPSQVMANQPISGVIRMRAAAAPGGEQEAQAGEQEAQPPVDDQPPVAGADNPPGGEHDGSDNHG